MKIYRVWSCLVMSVALLALVLCFGTTAFAYGTIDTERESSLTVYFGRNGNAFSGVEFRVYRVADVSAGARFTLSGDFTEYPVVVNGLDSSGWRTLAQTLDGYVARDNLKPLQTAKTGSDGRAYFARLDPGLYLVAGDRYRQGRYTYIPEPFLVCLPSLDGESDAWVYDAVASCKYDSQYNPPGGDDNTVDREVLKVWKDDGNEDRRPDEIVVQLLRDSEVYATVTLSADNNWRYTWTGLDDDHTWRVVEYQTPESYTVMVNREGITFVMTNTCDTPPDNPPETPPPGSPSDTPPDKPVLPQTGELWWPVPLLTCSGLLLFFIGWTRRRHAEQES